MLNATKTIMVLREEGSRTKVSVQFEVHNAPSHIPKGDTVFLKLSGMYALTVRSRVWVGKKLILHCDVDSGTIIEHLLTHATLIEGHQHEFELKQQEWE